MRRSFVAVLCLGVLVTSPALAGGYDTPILYSARHIGMGGTAVADVHDASALFHNPAGLGQIGKANVIGNVSLLVGDLLGNPARSGADPGVIRSEKTIAPFFLVGGALRLHDYISIGLAVYPVASAAGKYKYDGQTDETRLVFFEASPGIAFNFDKIGLRIGAGYRITYVILDRSREAGLPIDLKLTGLDFLSFRAGLQWRLTENLALGASYRHKSSIDLDQGASASGLGQDFVGAKATFVLPARVSAGLRFDYAAFGWATDFEYGFNDQNDRVTIEAELMSGGTLPIDNVFEWENQVTFRTGVEYRFVDQKLPVRLGFIYDAKTTDRAYPTAFGTPPTSTYSVTAGIGYDAGAFEVNVAYARRRGSTTVTQAEIDAAASGSCLACGGAGDYDLRLNGFYVDLSYDWE